MELFLQSKRASSCPLHQDLVRRHVLTGGASKNRFHTVDDVMRHEWFAVVLANVAFGLKAGLRAQVAGELTTVIIFDNNDAFTSVELVQNCLGVQWNQPFDLQIVCDNVLLIEQLLDGLANNTLS